MVFDPLPFAVGIDLYTNNSTLNSELLLKFTMRHRFIIVPPLVTVHLQTNQYHIEPKA